VLLRLLSLCILLGIALPAGLAQPPAPDDSYVYCYLVDNVHNVVYFSNVFTGDSETPATYEDAFHTQIRRLYPRAYGIANCTFDDTTYRAQSDKNKRKTRYADVYRTLIETNWAF
jgi:hypothetical protein